MPIETVCPNGHRLQVLPEQIGAKVRCPTCQTVFVASPKRAETSPADTASAKPAGDFRDEIPRPASDSAVTGRPVSSPGAEAWASMLAGRNRVLFGAQAVLGLGLLLVLSARGCDALTARSVVAQQSELKLAESRFDDTWEVKKQTLDDQLQDLMAKDNLTAGDRTEMESIRQKQKKLTEDMAKQRKENMRTTWHTLQINARDAEADAQSADYWHQWTFLIGTILLAFGLLVVGFNGVGAERWICLVILAILMFSVYVGGTVWTGR